MAATATLATAAAKALAAAAPGHTLCLIKLVLTSLAF